VLFCLVVLCTSVSAAEVKPPATTCVEACAEIAKKLAEQEQKSAQSRQHETGASEATAASQPALVPDPLCMMISFSKIPRGLMPLAFAELDCPDRYPNWLLAVWFGGI
ncbi:MAG: hypothetical protein OXF11_21475, partial [Deltaproteobacteria bacterium]|nr:hypothetical protein [Deltaproteobacteria bacterium]